jgi:hypothetical protein
MKTSIAVSAALILAGALGGCAAIERQDAVDTEKLLAAAGFQMRPADTPERQQDLANMPPRRLVVHRRQGAQTVYTYADAQNCNCLYVGDAKAYDEFRRLAVSEAIAQDMTEVSINPVFMRSGHWGARYPRPDPDDDSFPL